MLEEKKQNTQIVQTQKSVVESVTERLNQLVELGQINLPKDYSAPNAIRAAWLILQDQKTRDGKQVLSVATKDSVINAMFKMAISGLSVVKKQGDFILYGDKLCFQTEYHGNKALAMRYTDIIEVTHNTIYEGDEFEYIIDKHGRKQVSKHVQSIKNIDPNKIIGAYATVTFSNGETQSEVMNMQQIRKSWMQGATKGESPAHKNFPDRMCEKTVANRILTSFINSSSDGAILGLLENENENEATQSPAIAKDNALPSKSKTIAFDEAEIVNEEAKEGVVSEEIHPTANESHAVEQKPETKGGMQAQQEITFATSEKTKPISIKHAAPEVKDEKTPF